MGNLKDLTGQKFGELEVLRLSERRLSQSGRWYQAWDCRCACGRELPVPAQYLRSGKKSCGCLSPGPKALTAPEQLFRVYQRSAGQKGHEWCLLFDEFFGLTQRPCHYCGVGPTNTFNHHNQEPFLYNGIDRIRNDVGYARENLVPCCWVCNRAKLNMTYEQFLEYLSRIVSFRRYGIL